MRLLRWALCLGVLISGTGLQAFVKEQGEIESGLLKVRDVSVEKKIIHVEKEDTSSFEEDASLQGIQVFRDRKTGSIRLLYGNFDDVEALSSREASAFIELCKKFIQDHTDFLGLALTDVAPAEKGQYIGEDEQFVRFHVFRKGIRVKDASLDFRFKYGKLLQVVNQSFVEAVEIGSDNSRSDLLEQAEKTVNAKIVNPGEIFYRVVETSDSYLLEKVASFNVISEKDLPYLLELNAENGKVFELSQQFYSVSGHAEADLYPRWYDETMRSMPLSHLDIQTSKGPVRSNENGQFQADADAAPQVDGLKGQYVAVKDNKNNNVKAKGSLVSNLWSLKVEKQAGAQAWVDTSVAQSMIYDKVTAIVKRAKKYIDTPWFSKPLPANANLDSHCNAYWNGTSINLFTADSRCANTALIADVIYHEWGHGLHHNAEGIEDGALSEGFGDIMSLVMTESNLLGIGFHLANRGPVRDIKPARIYPRDKGEVHSEGLIIASTFWELYEKLVAKYGRTRGVDMLANYAFKMIFTSRTYLDVYHALLVIDSNGGDPAKGTPNQCLLNEVFSNHGIAQKEPACELASIETWDLQGERDGVIRPGSALSLRLKAKNAAAQVLKGLSADISSSGLPGSNVTGRLHWDDIATGTSEFSRNAVEVPIPSNAVCGQTFRLTANLKADKRELSMSKDWILGRNEGEVSSFQASGLPLTIKDMTTVTSSITAQNAKWKADTTVQSIELTFDVRHTYLGDLLVQLKGPDGTLTQVYKGTGRGKGSHHFEADLSGSFKGKKVGGEWQLIVRDTSPADEGALTSYSLKMTPALYTCH